MTKLKEKFGSLNFALRVFILTFIFGMLVFSPLLFRGRTTAESEDYLAYLTNIERGKDGLNQLSYSPELEKAALAKAQDMLALQYFEHTSPTGQTPWNFIEGAGYNYQVAGENLAIDFDRDNKAFAAWMASPSHQDNILNPKFASVGIGKVKGVFEGRETEVIVQMFASPRNVVDRLFDQLVLNSP